MARSPLNPRQREVRRLLVKHRGMISSTEIADRLQCNRTTVWRDRKAIAKHRPIKEEEASRLERDEIEDALQWFSQMEDQLLCDLEETEKEIEERQGENSQIPFQNVRCNLLGQLRGLMNERRQFLLAIGMLTEAPKTLRWEDALDAIRASKGLPTGENPFRKADDDAESVD